MSLEAMILIWILCAIVCGAIGHIKKRTAVGIILGALLGVLGVLIILMVPGKMDEEPKT